VKVTTVVSFADLALRRGYVTKESLQEAMLLHAVAMRRRQKASLGQVMVKAGFLTSEQAGEIEREEKAILEAQAQADLPEAVVSAMQLPANRVGKFVKLELIGRGGLGEVWRAYDLVIRRVVAIKFVQTMTPEHWQRFVKEAQILGRLNHPNIVPLYEIGDKFIVMPYIKGRTLDRVKLTVPQAVEAIRQAAVAIAHAHTQGVVHRDLKPTNLMIERGTTFVTDFGIAKELQVKECLSTTGDILGTPAYMSPEQVRAREVGPAADIYSLGATLYQLVAGALPFCIEDLYDMMRAIQEDDPVPPSRWNPQVSRDLDAIVLKALEKRPGDRYANASAMAEDLGRLLNGEPVRARPVGTLGKLARRAGRHKTGAALGLFAGLCVAFGIYGISAAREKPQPPAKSPEWNRQEQIDQARGGKQEAWQPPNAPPQERASLGGAFWCDIGADRQQAIHDHEESDRLLNKASQRAWYGNMDGALQNAQSAINADPTNPGGYFMAGRAYWEMNDKERALEMFRKYAAFGFKYAQGVEHYLRPDGDGRSQQDAMSLEQALASVRKDSNFCGGYFAAGRAYWEAGEFARAREMFRKYAAFGEKYAQAVAHYLEGEEQQQKEQAPPQPQAPVKGKPQYDHAASDFAVNDSNQMSRRGDYDAAVRAALRAIEKDPENPGGYYALGIAHWNRGNRIEARRAFEKYASFGPDQRKLAEQYIGGK
jgi:tetratricopeptide (TPR) repeat protein/predicted Ser/Thr protein kinase